MQRNKNAEPPGLRREQRSTRGKRMRAALEDESEGDAEFWNQDFWAEEAVDEDFKSDEEQEEEDVPDSDFDEPEDDAGEDEEVEDKPMKDDAPKRKAPKAPEIKAPPRPRAPPKPKPTPAEREEARQAALASVEAPTLRKSTKERTAEAQKERQVRVQSAPRRSQARSRATTWQPLTQAELLAEAARTEVENIQSLKYLMAMEEATKRKAAVVKQQYMGPTVKLISRKKLREHPPTAQDAAAAAPPATPAAGATGSAAAPATPAAAAAAAAAGASAAGGAAASATAATPGQAAAPASTSAAGATGQGADAAASTPGPTTGAATPSASAPPPPQPGPSLPDGEAVDASAAEEAAKAKAKKDQDNDGRRFESTLYYEICNMTYPPTWLRRFRAMNPVLPQKCAVTGLPARYRDPETGRAFANTAAFRRLHPEKLPSLSQPLPLDQVRPNSTNQKLGELNCSSGGGPDVMGGSLVSGSSYLGGGNALQGCRSFLDAAAHTATQLLPPEQEPLPEPSMHFHLVPPMALPKDMVALLTELHGPA